MPWGSGLCLWSAGITGRDLPGFYVGLGDQNWGTHAFLVRVLASELSPSYGPHYFELLYGFNSYFFWISIV